MKGVWVVGESRGNKRAVSETGGFGECTLVPVFGAGQHPNVPSFRLLVPGNIRMYPRSGFWYRGASAKTTLLETTLLRNPKKTFPLGTKILPTYDFYLREKNWEHSHREGIRKFLLFPNSGHFPLER